MSKITLLSRPLSYFGMHAANLAEKAIDRSVQIISPEWYGQRRWARALNAANSEAHVTELARLAANPRGAWRQAGIGDTGGSESTRAQRERTTIMWESRECINNFGFMKMLAFKYALYVIGRLIYQPATSDSGLNAILQDYIMEWFLDCDITGRFVFRKLCEMAYLGHKIDGDSGIGAVIRNGDIRLQLIQGDRIGNPFDYSYTEGYYSGVITDEVGAPTAYRIFRRTRNNIYLDPVEYQRQNFCHLFNPMHSDEYRGWSTNDTAIPAARQIFNIIQNELRAVNALSGQTAIVASKGNSAGAKWQEEAERARAHAKEVGVPAPQLPAQEIKPGTINYVSDGDSITAFTYNRPSPAFNGLIEAEFKEICDAWGADYNFFMGGGARGANIRLGSSQMQRVFQGEQENLRRLVIEPLIDLKLQFGMAMGHIPSHPEWRKKLLVFGPHATCDNGNDSAAEIEELKMGITSLDEIIMRRGISDGQIDQHVSRLGKTARLILETAKTYDVPVTMIQQRTPNGNGETGDDDSDPEQDSEETEPGEEKKGDPDETELMNANHDRRGRFARTSGAAGKGKPSKNQRAKPLGKSRPSGHLHRAIRGFLEEGKPITRSGRAGNFVVSDPKTKSVRVYFDPQGKGPRQRRKKHFYERVGFKRKVTRTAIAAGLLAAGLIGEKMYRQKISGTPAIKPLSPPPAPVTPEPAPNIATKRKRAKPSDELYGPAPKPRNRVSTKQKVKHKKAGGDSSSSLSLSRGGDKPKKV